MDTLIRTLKERKKRRREEQIELLLKLDLEPDKRTNEEKARIIMERLWWWDHPPAVSTLYEWRHSRIYRAEREPTLHNDDLAVRLRFWARQRLMAEVEPKLKEYEAILEAGPENSTRKWWETAQTVRRLAGLA